MHRVSIPQFVTDRVIMRCGRAHIYDRLDPVRTALIVVDMQNAFVMPGVWIAPCPTAREIVPNINRIASALRAAGGTVVWVKTVASERAMKTWSTFHAMARPELARRRNEVLTPGHQGYELWSDLDVQGADLTVHKEVFSAFMPGPDNLAEILRARGIDTVVVTGALTNVCCESTARDAMMMNFRTIMVSDGNAAITDEEHNMSLSLFYTMFGDVAASDDVIASLNAVATSAP